MWSEEAVEFVEEWVKKSSIFLIKSSPIDDTSIGGNLYQTNLAGGKPELLSSQLEDKKLALKDKKEYDRYLSTSVERLEQQICQPGRHLVRNVNANAQMTKSTRSPDTKVTVPLSGFKSKTSNVKIENVENNKLLRESKQTESSNLRPLRVDVLVRGSEVLAPYEKLEDFPHYKLVEAVSSVFLDPWIIMVLLYWVFLSSGCKT